MSFARHKAAHTVLSGRLFVIGGDDEQGTDLKSVEHFDPSTNEWQTVAPMRQKRYSPAACVSHGFIYVFGGYGDGVPLSSVERYDSRQNSWTEVTLYPRNDFSSLEWLIRKHFLFPDGNRTS